jgi:hypothetical protein
VERKKKKNIRNQPTNKIQTKYKQLNRLKKKKTKEKTLSFEKCATKEKKKE